jgi:hypothetical protein
LLPPDLAVNPCVSSALNSKSRLLNTNAVHFVHDRHQRSAFIANLSPAERERLKGFETVKGDWHEFRDLLHH